MRIGWLTPRVLRPFTASTCDTARPVRWPAVKRAVPSTMTLVGLCAGLAGLRFALEGRFGAAALAILVAAVMDGVDGRVARMLGAESRFGAEIDSLADVICFGVVPSFVLYAWSLSTAGWAGFAPCAVFVACMALRLARFNAALDAPPRTSHPRDFFVGVPAPAGAGLALFPVFVGLQAQVSGWDGLADLVHSATFCAVVLIGTALLLVSTLPVWSFKNFHLNAPRAVLLLVTAAALSSLLVAAPWAVLACGGLFYLGMLPFSGRNHRRRKAIAAMEGNRMTESGMPPAVVTDLESMA